MSEEDRPIRSRSLVGWFAIVNGLNILITWPVLLITGQAPGWREQLLSLSFHWTAELATVLSLIVGGIAVLRRQRDAARLHMLSLGLVLCAMLGALGHYTLVDPQLGFIIMITVLISATLVVVALNLRRHLFFELGLGFVLYQCINLLGVVLQRLAFAYFVALALCALVIIGLLWQSRQVAFGSARTSARQPNGGDEANEEQWAGAVAAKQELAPQRSDHAAETTAEIVMN